jgi:hypothetical protein
MTGEKFELLVTRSSKLEKEIFEMTNHSYEIIETTGGGTQHRHHPKILFARFPDEKTAIHFDSAKSSEVLDLLAEAIYSHISALSGTYGFNAYDITRLELDGLRERLTNLAALDDSELSEDMQEGITDSSVFPYEEIF